MKMTSNMDRRTNTGRGLRGAARLFSVLMALVLGHVACAVDEASPAVDAGDDQMLDAPDDQRGGGADGDARPRFDGPSYFDLGMPMTEPPLIVPTCVAASGAGEVCCASPLGFEDASTMHFLTPTCCELGLSEPEVVMSPTACGEGALRMKVDFRAVPSGSMCGVVDEVEACSYQRGELTRSVLTPLDLTGLTFTAMLHLQGPPLPPVPAQARLFVVARAGVIEGEWAPLDRLAAWMRFDLPLANLPDGSAADVRVIGLSLDFAGQAWAGSLYLDEVTWR